MRLKEKKEKGTIKTKMVSHVKKVGQTGCETFQCCVGEGKKGHAGESHGLWILRKDPPFKKITEKDKLGVFASN